LVLAQIIIIIFIIIITGVQEFCYSARAVLYFAHKIKRCRINEWTQNHFGSSAIFLLISLSNN